MTRSMVQKAERFYAMAREVTELKNQIEADRVASIKEKLEINSKALETQTSHLLRLAESRAGASKADQTSKKSALDREGQVCLYDGLDAGSPEEDVTDFQQEFQEESPSAGVTASQCRDNKSAVKLVKLPYVETIPPYTTAVFLNRNEITPEGQSASSQRLIYYDHCKNETVICSDSEDEIPETEGEKNFSRGEDILIWKIIQKHGLTDDVLGQLGRYIDASSSKIQERYENLLAKSKMPESIEPLPHETLAAAMHSFDALFCRRCLMFVCNLHECPSTPIIPRVKLSSSVPNTETNPCENFCFMKRKDVMETRAGKGPLTSTGLTKKSGERKEGEEHGMWPTENSTRRFRSSYQRRKKRAPISDVDSLVNEEIQSMSLDDAVEMDQDARERNGPIKMNDNPHLDCSSKELNSQAWSTMEKDLYAKGVEIFGMNSCLISRNLLSGLKTCEQVWQYMNKSDGAATHDKPLIHSNAESIEVDQNLEEGEKRQKWAACRGFRLQKVRFARKSVGQSLIRKRTIYGTVRLDIQYTPCACHPSCGEQCPCKVNGSFCLKYCGCPNTSCDYQLPGCRCIENKCRTECCPCFANNRECDPDECQNCWISCGDGSLGVPPVCWDGDGHGCANMNILLKKNKKILLAKSDVAGWGVFTQNSLNKDDFIGEYTGELISHGEADKRGKIYDRANSSYLFNLNIEYVLDAYRKGDKLKFANHSSNANCYTKVMLVGSEHKIGIYAKKRIEAGEELFFDYGYGCNQAPPWARKQKTPRRAK